MPFIAVRTQLLTMFMNSLSLMESHECDFQGITQRMGNFSEPTKIVMCKFCICVSFAYV